jgi:hypothetical protein
MLESHLRCVSSLRLCYFELEGERSGVAVPQGQMVKCSFHGSPTQGVQYQGANTYYSIVPNPQLAARSLGVASTQVRICPQWLLRLQHL